MAKGPLSKSALVQILSDKSANELTRKDVKGLLEAMVSIGHAELKKNGVFVVPGLVRMVVVKKPATKEAQGHQPVHRPGDDLQGQASPQGGQGAPGKGCQGRRSVGSCPLRPTGLKWAPTDRGALARACATVGCPMGKGEGLR